MKYNIVLNGKTLAKNQSLAQCERDVEQLKSHSPEKDYKIIEAKK